MLGFQCVPHGIPEVRVGGAVPLYDSITTTFLVVLGCQCFPHDMLEGIRKSDHWKSIATKYVCVAQGWCDKHFEGTPIHNPEGKTKGRYSLTQGKVWAYVSSFHDGKMKAKKEGERPTASMIESMLNSLAFHHAKQVLAGETIGGLKADCGTTFLLDP